MLFRSTNKMTNVVTKITVGRDNNSPRSAEVVFAMNNVGGIYSIAQMTVPGIEKRNQELDDARRSLGQLVVAINGRSIEVVKGLVSFGGAVDFDAELSARGLSWIKEAIDNCVNAPKYNMSASREGRDSVIGRVYVPSVPGGTNVLRKVVFKGVKIDRAAPLEEARD